MRSFFCSRLKNDSIAALSQAAPTCPIDPTPMMMQLGADGVFVGSGIFKSGEPEERSSDSEGDSTF